MQEKIERCRKVPHTRDGYLHGEDDDGPYLVDGVKYCGRCHRYDCRGFMEKMRVSYGYALVNGSGDVIGVYEGCGSEDDAVEARADDCNVSEDWVRNQLVECCLRWQPIEICAIDEIPERYRS